MKKKIQIVPNNNSIAHTCREVLKDEFDIVNKSEDYADFVFDIGDKFSKKVTETIFFDKKYYPKPKHGELCIKKPSNGSSSKGIELKIYNDNFFSDSQNVYQKYIKGKEYTVDVLIINDTLKNFAVRERHNIWNGISMKSIFTNKYDRKVKKILKDIIKELSIVDMLLTVQFIKDKKGKFWLTEINYRPCANMCYGGDDNFILNYIRWKLYGVYLDGKIKTKKVERCLGWKEE